MEAKKTFVSALSKKEFSEEERINLKNLRQAIFKLIQDDYPELTEEDSISLNELNYYREKYITSFLSDNISDLSKLRDNVLRSMREQSLTRAKETDPDTIHLNVGQRIADRVASFGGSWTFILSFFLFLILWIAVNLINFSHKTFDPYPFILLNLILSCLAAIQAPVIMMSQNRQEQKDRERAKKDFVINLKAELEIRILHEKLDHLIMHQQQELIEIQKIQVDIMNEIYTQVKRTT
ncbi:MAG: hypothetical protein RIT43_2024 [Bacteroidota bacterium]|jgi:uncharacterized membrane protein